MKFNLSIEGEKREFEVVSDGTDFEYKSGDLKRIFKIKKLWGNNILITDEKNRVFNVFVDKNGDGQVVFFKGKSFRIKDATSRKKGVGFDIEGEVVVKSPLPGQIKKIFKNVNDEVDKGESILVLEAMKMENEIKSPKKGKITKISVEENGSVDPQSELFTVE